MILWAEKVRSELSTLWSWRATSFGFGTQSLLLMGGRVCSGSMALSTDSCVGGKILRIRLDSFSTSTGSWTELFSITEVAASGGQSSSLGSLPRTHLAPLNFMGAGSSAKGLTLRRSRRYQSETIHATAAYIRKKQIAYYDLAEIPQMTPVIHFSQPMTVEKEGTADDRR